MQFGGSPANTRQFTTRTICASGVLTEMHVLLGRSHAATLGIDAWLPGIHLRMSSSAPMVGTLQGHVLGAMRCARESGALLYNYSTSTITAAIMFTISTIITL